jgi:hypothetical protein
MTNRVHAAVDAMESTRANPARNSLCAKPGFEQLVGGDDPMLPGGDPGDHRVGGGELLAHTANKSP